MHNHGQIARLRAGCRQLSAPIFASDIIRFAVLVRPGCLTAPVLLWWG